MILRILDSLSRIKLKENERKFLSYLLARVDWRNGHTALISDYTVAMDISIGIEKISGYRRSLSRHNMISYEGARANYIYRVISPEQWHAGSACRIGMPDQHAELADHQIECADMPNWHAESACRISMPDQHAESACPPSFSPCTPSITQDRVNIYNLAAAGSLSFSSLQCSEQGLVLDRARATTPGPGESEAIPPGEQRRAIVTMETAVKGEGASTVCLSDIAVEELLTEVGVSGETARRLIAEKGAARCYQALEWLPYFVEMAERIKPVRSLAGYLITIIDRDYKKPKGYDDWLRKKQQAAQIREKEREEDDERNAARLEAQKKYERLDRQARIKHWQAISEKLDVWSRKILGDYTEPESMTAPQRSILFSALAEMEASSEGVQTAKTTVEKL